MVFDSTIYAPNSTAAGMQELSLGWKMDYW